MKLLINTNFDQDEEESLFDINKIISIIKFKTTPYYQEYKMPHEFFSLNDSPVVVPLIYSE